MPLLSPIRGTFRKAPPPTSGSTSERCSCASSIRGRRRSRASCGPRRRRHCSRARKACRRLLVPAIGQLVAGVLAWLHEDREFVARRGGLRLGVEFAKTPPPGHFTSKHASWLNQIETWFGTLCRKLLNRESFASKADLEAAIVSFLDYYNRHLAHPYRWTHSGTPCRA